MHFNDASIGSGFMKGIVFYNSAVSRPDLVLPDGNALGGLHCEDCIEVIIDGAPQIERIEMDEDWFVIIYCIPCGIPYGQTIKFL